jgi:hypothetical protein
VRTSHPQADDCIKILINDLKGKMESKDQGWSLCSAVQTWVVDNTPVSFSIQEHRAQELEQMCSLTGFVLWEGGEMKGGLKYLHYMTYLTPEQHE